MATKAKTEQFARETAAPFQVKPSERSTRVRYAIRDVMLVADEAKAAGKQIVYLNIGDPPLYDFPTPPHILRAVEDAMLAGRNGYAASVGTAEALQAIRAEAARDGIRKVQDVFVTSGVSEAIETTMAALLNPGENVLIPSPGYPLYDAALVKLSAESVSYNLDEAAGWQPDLDDMARKINGKTRAIVVINPNNPTGSVCSRETLQGICDLAARHGLVIFADEIYSKLILDPGVKHIPLASLAPELPVLTLNGMSKAYLVPGFRIGWVIVSGEEKSLGEYREAIAKILRARLSASHPMQYAIRPALEGDQSHIPVVIEKLRKRRDLTVSILNSFSKIHCVPPQGAFYAFPRLEIARSDDAFVKDLIRQTGVVVVPGSGFGQAPGTKHFRLVFLPPEEQLRSALSLIGQFAQSSS